MYLLGKKLAAYIEDAVSLKTADNVIKKIRPGKEVRTPQDKIDIIAYGINFLIGSALKILAIVLISTLLGSMKTTLVMAAVFSSFRMLAGGQHMDTYLKCLVATLIIFLIFGTIAQYVSFSVLFTQLILLFTIIFSVYTTIRFVPGVHPNHPIRKSKQKKLKIISLVYLVFFAALMILINPGKYVVAGCFGMLWICFTIIPSGYKLFEKINGGLKLKC